VHSDKIPAQLLMDWAQLAGIRDVVISPGSRNAPLIIEAIGRAGLRKRTVTDERSAAFVALGLAESTGRPVMTLCTSGTAVLNEHPAVAEAFYRRIPLVVVSADRPEYRIDKGEGQSIRQRGVLQNHTVASVHLAQSALPEQWNDTLRHAFDALIRQQGPIHINIPFEEPLYGQTDRQTAKAEGRLTPPAVTTLPDEELDRLEKIWKEAGPKLIIAAQGHFDPMVRVQLERLARMEDTVVLTENTANIQGKDLLEHIDRLIFPLTAEQWEDYAPGLVVTIGNNIISKKIKYLLRGQKRPFTHWHIGRHYLSPDTFDRLTAHVQMAPVTFFSQLLFRLYDYEVRDEYAQRWHHLARMRQKAHESFLQRTPWSDLKFYEALSRLLRGDWHVHWANSTVVRYAQLFPFEKHVKHYANRGTSGIDGSMSTAVGFALGSGRPVLHVTGDLSFIYDSNALWNHHPANLKVMVVQNGGGDIFRFIPGPSTVEDFEKYFVAPHQVDLLRLAHAYGEKAVPLTGADNKARYAALQAFLEDKESRILVVDTASAANAQILKDYFAALKCE